MFPRIPVLPYTYTPEIAPGHWDLRGDMEELKSYLVADFIARV